MVELTKRRKGQILLPVSLFRIFPMVWDRWRIMPRSHSDLALTTVICFFSAWMPFVFVSNFYSFSALSRFFSVPAQCLQCRRCPVMWFQYYWLKGFQQIKCFTFQLEDWTHKRFPEHRFAAYFFLFKLAIVLPYQLRSVWAETIQKFLCEANIENVLANFYFF